MKCSQGWLLVDFLDFCFDPGYDDNRVMCLDFASKPEGKDAGLNEVQARLGIVMIEAVNAVVANASVLRGSAEAVSTARSFAANPERVQEVVQAPYISPYISMDVNYNKAV